MREEEGEGEREREKKKKLLSVGSFSKFPQWLVVNQDKANSKGKSLWLFHMGGMDPIT